MRCDNCNFELTKDTNFCKNCGAKVNKFKIGFSKKLRLFIKDNKGVFALLAVIIFFAFIFSISLMLSYSPNNSGSTDNTVAKVLSDKEKQPGGFFDDNLKKSVVNVICSDEKDKYFDNPSGGGSGTMISPTGVVMTNFHVVSGDKQKSLENVRCMVILAEPKLGGPSEIYIAKPIAFKDISLKYDLAFLDIISSYTDEKGDSYGDYNKDFAIYDDSVCLDGGDPMLGEKVKILGYPSVSGGNSLTITDGLVSSFDEDGNIITSAKIDSGNSGGLAVDDNGCIVGVPSAVTLGTYENLGVVISTNNVNGFLKEFRERNESEQRFKNISFELNKKI